MDEDSRKALAKAGLDPAKGMTTSERNGVKRPDMVDWIAVVKSAEAEQALPKMGAELERAGWKPARVEGNILTYRKSGWSLLASSLPGGAKMPKCPRRQQHAPAECPPARRGRRLTPRGTAPQAAAADLCVLWADQALGSAGCVLVVRAFSSGSQVARRRGLIRD
ncbi:hypothetical protein [Streptomyces sp. A1547]|uniref:Uncharacterized protein n=1 Tax=Streptomyces sp. R33 TaxID=3238629 RepID=A0AB39YFE0_9ACTN|nr:hypothetical protein [Streptomyces sp. A1547]THA29037.1 hypothetical protein E6W17_40130 [Streptomyces sp. A1547]